MDNSHKSPESARPKSDHNETAAGAADRMAKEAAQSRPRPEIHVSHNHSADKHLPGLDISANAARGHFADSIEKLFPKIDSNHNGRISLNELADAIGDKRYKGADAEALVVLRNLIDDSDPKYAKRGVGVSEVEEARHSAGMREEVTNYVDTAHNALTAGSDLKLYGTAGITKDACVLRCP